MVKRKRIAGKPGQPPPEADSWVKSGGTDPEVQPIEQSKEPEVEAEPEDKGKPYPHRVSFDMASPQYKRLKRAAFEEERSMNEILREAVEDWMKTRNY
jgi:hypothetical protein